MQNRWILLTLLVILAMLLASLPAQGRDADYDPAYPGPEMTATATVDPYPPPLPTPTSHHKGHRPTPTHPPPPE